MLIACVGDTFPSSSGAAQDVRDQNEDPASKFFLPPLRGSVTIALMLLIKCRPAGAWF
jgi:hypothetical protein